MPIPSLFDLHRDPYASANEVALYGAQLHDVRFLRDPHAAKRAQATWKRILSSYLP